jgi:lactoylglutathione lyase
MLMAGDRNVPAVIELVKPALDVGLYTNRVDEVRAFYEGELGLAYNHLLKAGRGVHQHRLDLDSNGAVLKVNAARDPLGDAPTGYVGLAVVGARPRALRDPDGLAVEVVAALPGDAQVRVTVASSDVAAHDRWFAEGMGAARVGDAQYVLGSTLLVVHHVADQPQTETMFARGFRYLTVQVADVVAEHRRLVDMGFASATEPVRLGDVAAISFVRDPGGNWLEISQRASLTGALPTNL